MAIGIKVRQLVQCDGNHLVGVDFTRAADANGDWKSKVVGV